MPLTGGTSSGPELNGELIGGTSADWQIVPPDRTALGDIRYMLKTDGGALLYVRFQSVRHGSAEVLARLARGDYVDASVPRLDPDRNGRNRTRLAEQGDIHRGRRPPRRRRHLRDLPRRLIRWPG